MPNDIVLSKILCLKKTRVVGWTFTADGLVLDVKPTLRFGRCSGCFE